MNHFTRWNQLVVCAAVLACVAWPPASFAVPVTLSFTQYTNDGSGFIDLTNRPDGTALIRGDAQFGGGDADGRGTVVLGVTADAPAGTPIELSVTGFALYYPYPYAWAQFELFRGATLLLEFNDTTTQTVLCPATAGETLTFQGWVLAHGGDGEFGHFSADFIATPEPATLSGLALAGLIVIRRR